MEKRNDLPARYATEEETQKQKEYTEKIANMIADGTPKKACVVTYGCQQNEADSERIAGMLHAMGYEKTEKEADADIIIVNTCSVRDHAEQRALSITGGYKHLKAKKTSLIIGISGCMVSKQAQTDKIKHSYPYIDFTFGTEKLWQLPEILYHVMTEEKSIFCPNEGKPITAEGIPVLR